MESIHLNDRLKSLNEINEADHRQKYFNFELEDLHSTLNSFELRPEVPKSVRQQFETAKNVALYSWFVYRFHQVAELHGFITLEMALRERYLAENPNTSKHNLPNGLHQFLAHANKHKWLTNSGFPSLYLRAKRLAEYKKFSEFELEEDDEGSQKTIAEPTKEELQTALSEIDIVKGLVESSNKLRNNLAHGSETLHPNSLDTLSTIYEAINQLFSS